MPWIAPILFSGLIGCGIIWSFAGIFTFLVESYPLHAASALAANSFARSVFAAAFPLFGDQVRRHWHCYCLSQSFADTAKMYENLGYQWASSLLAFLCLMMAPFPYIFFKYGKTIRKRSRYATVKD